MLEVLRTCTIPVEQDVELNSSEKWEGGGARMDARETWKETALILLLSWVSYTTQGEIIELSNHFHLLWHPRNLGRQQYHMSIRLQKSNTFINSLSLSYNIYIWACSNIHTLTPPLTVCSSLPPISIQLLVYSSSCPVKHVPWLGAYPDVWSAYQGSHH